MNRPAAVAFNDDLVLSWKDACDRIVNQKTVDYVLVTGFGNAWQGSEPQRQALDNAARAVGAELPSSVTSMLLPKIVRNSQQNAATAIDAGQKMMGRGRRRGLRYSTWGHTYFERMTGAWYDRHGAKNEIKKKKKK